MAGNTGRSGRSASMRFSSLCTGASEDHYQRQCLRKILAHSGNKYPPRYQMSSTASDSFCLQGRTSFSKKMVKS